MLSIPVTRLEPTIPANRARVNIPATIRTAPTILPSGVTGVMSPNPHRGDGNQRPPDAVHYGIDARIEVDLDQVDAHAPEQRGDPGGR